MSTRRQGRYFLCTIPRDAWELPTVLPEHLAYLKGQQEEGASGYKHWQLLAIFTKSIK